MTKRNKNLLLLELIAVFILLPLIISILKPRGAIYYVLWGTTIACCWWLSRQSGFSFKKEWAFDALTKANLKPILLRFLPCAIGLLGFILVTIPEKAFALPLQRPQIWVMVMTFYPLLSVIPQEIIFRSFFFKRYNAALSPKMMVILSSITFGWVHIILQNWVAVIFSAIGGFIFCNTYKKTKSLSLVCFEHAIYGCYIFTIGMGYYFYHGTAVK
jgi:uncharacterized protein